MSAKKASKKALPKASGGPHGPMDVEFLQEIVKVMRANDLSAVDLRDGDRRIVLQRGAAGPVVMPTSPAALPPHAYAPSPIFSAAPPASASSPPLTAAGHEDEAAALGLIPIKSPMVGTFYARPNPESKPFVSVGTRVDEETDVCVIEAMKTFNTLKAECRGTIARILVENGQTVEFGTALFLVKP
jgi:acetyl-CoA carboxylase biotin carboxyl carrier protein